MSIEFVAEASHGSLPIRVVVKDRLADAALDGTAAAWAAANGFSGEAGRVLVVPGKKGALGGALFGIGHGDDAFGALGFGALARNLPEGQWHFASKIDDPDVAAIGLR